jgi:3-oxoacyl-[acyl-carrier protein] reductase
MTAVKEETKTAGTKRLSGKVALVTGGSRGIGAAIASRLAADGASVVITYSSSKSEADQVVSKMKELGTNAAAIQANVSSEQDSKKLVAEVQKSFGRIDILVNNAGVFETKTIEEVDLDHYLRLFDVNVKGVIATTIAALPHIPDGGRIINISSGAATATMSGASVYSATKAALDTLTRVWAQDLGKRKITVNCVSPGTTATEMLQKGFPEEAKQMMISKTALGRLGEPSDIADAVAFLASHDGRWVTGHVLNCNGGINI